MLFYFFFSKFRFIRKNTRCRAALDGLNDTPCAILPQIRKTPDSRFRTNRIGPGEKIHLQSVKFVTTSFYGKKLLYVAKYSLCLVTMLNCLLSQACKLPEACNAIPVQAKNLQAAYHNNTTHTIATMIPSVSKKLTNPELKFLYTFKLTD